MRERSSWRMQRRRIECEPPSFKEPSMQLTLLGTGCPQVDLHRYGPANLVRAGGRCFLVDCGSGVTQRLLGAGATGAQIDAVLLTHLHSDHVVDLFQLVISSWHQARD